MLSAPNLAVAPTIVVIDDNVVTTRALTKVLETHGYGVVALLSCADALSWLSANARARPAAIVVDIHLPDGSGLDLARRARQLYDADIPILILSGDTSIENLKSLPQGRTMFLAKPLHAPTFLEELKTWTAAQ